MRGGGYHPKACYGIQYFDGAAAGPRAADPGFSTGRVGFEAYALRANRSESLGTGVVLRSSNSPIGLLADVAKKPRRVGTEGPPSLGKLISRAGRLEERRHRSPGNPRKVSRVSLAGQLGCSWLWQGVSSEFSGGTWHKGPRARQRQRPESPQNVRFRQIIAIQII